MKRKLLRIQALAALGATALASGCALMEPAEPLQLAGAECVRPPVQHCPEADCPGEMVIDQGPVVEPTTGRNYFLDYPCDLRPGEDVTLILSLHGGGSYGNWQRHYFPILDYVDEHRLVVATPNAPIQFWTTEDDEYLQTLVASLIDEIGEENISSFWLAGHSQGGMTSNRLVCTDFFADKVDGWLSLSGGRIGPAGLAPSFGIGGGGAAADDEGDAPAEEAAAPALPAFPPIDGANGPERAQPGSAVTPKCDINYIFTTGNREIAGLPEDSPWAEKYHCDARVRRDDIVDTEPGYVYASNAQEDPNPAWGLLPRPGTAEVYVYPNCDGGRVVADVMRLDKGHTEGLEPVVTETLIEMMLAAPGGKLRSNS
ncbi:MAG: alpha/beta hydrolase [Maricaulaceae bacterium]|jgi:hypothetical protein